jgi:hypothetical protein
MGFETLRQASVAMYGEYAYNDDAGSAAFSVWHGGSRSRLPPEPQSPWQNKATY